MCHAIKSCNFFHPVTVLYYEREQSQQMKQNGNSGELLMDIKEKYRNISCRPEPDLIRQLVEKVVVESREKVHIHLVFADEMSSLQKRIAGERI